MSLGKDQNSPNVQQDKILFDAIRTTLDTSLKKGIIRNEKINFAAQVVLAVSDSAKGAIGAWGAGATALVATQVVPSAIVGAVSAPTVLSIGGATLTTSVAAGAIGLAAVEIKKLVTKIRDQVRSLDASYRQRGTGVETITDQAKFDRLANAVISYARIKPERLQRLIHAKELGEQNSRGVTVESFNHPMEKLAFELGVNSRRINSSSWQEGLSSIGSGIVTIVEICDSLHEFHNDLESFEQRISLAQEEIDGLFMLVEQEITSSPTGVEVFGYFGFALAQLEDARQLLIEAARKISDYIERALKA